MKVNAVQLHEQNSYFIRHLPKTSNTIRYEFIKPDGSVVELPGNFNQPLTVPVGSTGIIVMALNIITHKKNSAGDMMEMSEWQANLSKLNENADGDGYFHNLDEEYAYKKFTTEWCSSVYAEQIKTETLDIVVDKHVKFETGNPWITSTFSIDDNPSSAVYVYNRKGAQFDIVKQVMSSLGIEYEAKVSYEKTKEKKVWGGDEIRWVVAFGKYLFDESFTAKFNPTGTLEGMIASYDADVATITNRIKTKYAEHFSTEIMDGIRLSRASSELHSILTAVAGIDAKVSGQSNKNAALKKIRSLLDDINTELTKSVGV